MADCLDNLVGKRFWCFNKGSRPSRYQNDRSKAPVRNQCYEGLKFKTPASWNRVEEGGSSSESLGEGVIKKDWRRAVIVVRFSTLLSWRNIHFRLSKIFKIQHDINPIAANKAVIWSTCDEEKRRLEKMGFFNIPGVGKFRTERWNTENQFIDNKIECRSSWVGIEGLPLNMWNKHFFNQIGEKCGGLLDIANSTADLSRLSFAKLKLQGNQWGLIPERLDLYCWRKIFQIKLFSLKGSFSSTQGIRNDLVHEFREEDEDDVEVQAEMTVMAEKAKGDSSTAFTAFSDIKRRGTVAGWTDERRLDFTKSGQEGLPRDLAADTHTSLKKVFPEKQRCQKETADLSLHNRFNLLSTKVTCEKVQSSQFSEPDMGLGGLGDIEKSYLGLGDKLNFDTGLGINETDLGDNGQYSNGLKAVPSINGKPFSRPIAPGRCFKKAQLDYGPSSSRATLKKKLDMGLDANLNSSTGLGVMGLGCMGSNQNIDMGLGINEMGLGVNGQYSSELKTAPSVNGKMRLFTPITPGHCFKRAQSDFGPSSSRATPKDDSGISNHGPNCLDQVSARGDSFLTHKPLSWSHGPLVRRANSEPGSDYSRMGKLVGRLNRLRPKSRDNFSKGCIFRWDDSVKDKREANQLKNFNCSVALTARDDFNATRNNSVTKDLKVYVRKRVPLCPKYGLIPEKDSDLMEDLIGEVESDAEGDKEDKQLLSSTNSISSSSDSEESFHSERAKEEDADTRLEGISSLMTDSFSIDNNKQQAMLQEDNSIPKFSGPLNNLLVQVQTGDMEEERASDISRGTIRSTQEIRTSENKMVEWKEVQALLSNLGIQLIHRNSNTNLEEKTGSVKKKQGTRELQRLNFNVNYDRGSCSRGKKFPL